MKPVIDISKFNTVYDWDAVKNNVSAVIIRLGYSGYSRGNIVVDPKYYEFRKACEEHKIPFSIYFFPQSITDAEADREADFIIANAQDIKDRPMPVWLDSEIADVKNKKGRADDISVALRTRMLKRICERVQAAGIECGIYASTSWLNTRLKMSDLPYPVWVAQYSNKMTYKGGNVLIWQYTSQEHVPGVKTGNRDYVDASHWIAEQTKAPYVVGWNSDANGWWYADTTKTYVKDAWKVINHHKYYFGSDGYIVRGWKTIDGELYYFAPDGELEGALYHTDDKGAQKIWEL